jgi:hypothetical protein
MRPWVYRRQPLSASCSAQYQRRTHRQAGMLLALIIQQQAEKGGGGRRESGNGRRWCDGNEREIDDAARFKRRWAGGNVNSHSRLLPSTVIRMSLLAPLPVPVE